MAAVVRASELFRKSLPPPCAERVLRQRRGLGFSVNKKGRGLPAKAIVLVPLAEVLLKILELILRIMKVI